MQKEQDSFSDLEGSRDDETEEIATRYNISIPEVLMKVLEDDYYKIKKDNKLVHLPCTPHVVDILEGYLRHYAAELTASTTKRSMYTSQQKPPIDSSEAEARFSLCKETMDGVRVTFSHYLSNNLLYDAEQRQNKLVTTFCKPVRICRTADMGDANETFIQSQESLRSTPSDMKSTTEHLLTESPQASAHRTRSRPPQREDSDKRLPGTSGSSTGSPSSSASSLPASTFEATQNRIESKFDCTLLSSELLQKNPSSPALLYGAHHLLRLFVKLPEVLKKMEITKTKAFYLERFVNGLLNYMACRQTLLFPPSVYENAEKIMAELEEKRKISVG